MNANNEEEKNGSLMELGSVPLPKTEDMPKWLVVVTIMGIVIIFGYLIISHNQRNADKDKQIENCQDNYNQLMDKFVFAESLEASEKMNKQKSESVVRKQVGAEIKNIYQNENTN